MANFSFMRRLVPAAAAAAMTAAMMFGFGTVSFAATAELIDSVSISLSYELANGMSKSDVDVNCDSEGVGDITVSSISNNSYGKKPKVVLKLKREDNDYAFKVSGSSLGKSGVSITGDDANVSKVSCTASTANWSRPCCGAIWPWGRKRWTAISISSRETSIPEEKTRAL